MTTPLLLQLQKLKDQFHQATSAGFTPNPTLLGNHPNSSTLLNPTQCAQLLTQAKILLTTHPLASHFLLPHGDVKALTSDELQILMLTRDLLEMGTFYAIHLKDVHLFEQYYHQVSIYYAWPLPGSSSSASTSKHAQVVGFYLLHLLAQNRMAEFHATLETVSHLDHMYIQQAMHLEQAIMEGTYQRVWQVHQNLSNSLETQWFMELLMETIRQEIASCAMTSYTSLPVTDAMRLLFFTHKSKVMEFGRDQHWVIQNEVIHFTPLGVGGGGGSSVLGGGEKGGEASSIVSPGCLDTTELITYALGYAKELETIV